jgi:hypothetical protein
VYDLLIARNFINSLRFLLFKGLYLLTRFLKRKEKYSFLPASPE